MCQGKFCETKLLGYFNTDFPKTYFIRTGNLFWRSRNEPKRVRRYSSGYFLEVKRKKRLHQKVSGVPDS